MLHEKQEEKKVASIIRENKNKNCLLCVEHGVPDAKKCTSKKYPSFQFATETVTY